MNKKEHQDLELVLYRLDEQDSKRINLETEVNKKLVDIHKDIRFIKESLFNPDTGLWAEVKQNSRFRESSDKWRTMTGAALLTLIVKSLYEFFIQ
jgi:hypothetical protein